MPKFITIQGDPATLRSVSDVANLWVLQQSAQQIGPNTWTVDAFVDPATEAAVIATGARVVYEKSDADVAGHTALALADISDAPLDLGIA